MENQLSIWHFLSSFRNSASLVYLDTLQAFFYNLTEVFLANICFVTLCCLLGGLRFHFQQTLAWTFLGRRVFSDIISRHWRVGLRYWLQQEFFIRIDILRLTCRKSLHTLLIWCLFRATTNQRSFHCSKRLNFCKLGRFGRNWRLLRTLKAFLLDLTSSS